MEESKDSEFSTYIQKNIRSIADSIKFSSNLPVGTARVNFIACFPRFQNEVRPFSDQILWMLSSLLQKEGIRGNVEDCDHEEKVDLVVDGVNKILDRARDHLNDLNGIKRNPLIAEAVKSSDKSYSGSWNRDTNKSMRWKTNAVGNYYPKAGFRMQKVLDKPQDKFEVKIDNSNTPFEPMLSSKPNAIKPLAVYLETNQNGVTRYCHPYLHELNAFKVPPSQLENVKPAVPLELGTTCPIFVDNEEMLNDMMVVLKNAKELAVDLEHHSYRSYQGLTCLMQISTRKVDLIIDTLALRNKLSVLNEIFTDPNVVKVFHDGSSDVIWLQKDFNLYVVNMFDTYLASLTLNFPKLSLSFLMKEFCDLESDKRYQLFDWRIRPLPEAALKYARTDTHYLLYIYDKLRNALLEKANGSTQLLESVYSRGVSICKRKHEKLTTENDYLGLYKQSKQTFDNRQMHALKSLFEWRDNVAREEDESTGFVLPNHMLLQIAEMLPREMQGILACCNPIPALVRKNLSQLHQLISVSRNLPINRNIIQNDVHSSALNKNTALSKLRCPHDFSHHDDFRDNLATLLGGSDVINTSGEDQVPAIPLLNEMKGQAEEQIADCRRKTKQTEMRFVSPYERYKRTIVFLLSTQEKEKETKSFNVNANIVYSPKEECLVKAKEEPEREPFMKRAFKEIIEEQSSSDETKAENFTKVASTKGIKRKLSSVDEKLQINQSSETGAINSSKCGSIRVDNSSSAKDGEKEEESSSTVSHSSDAKLERKRKEKSGGPHALVEKPAFKPFDYAQANFNRFVTNGQKNIKQLLSTKIIFGANKKETKNKKFRK